MTDKDWADTKGSSMSPGEERRDAGLGNWALLGKRLRRGAGKTVGWDFNLGSSAGRRQRIPQGSVSSHSSPAHSGLTVSPARMAECKAQQPGPTPGSPACHTGCDRHDWHVLGTAAEVPGATGRLAGGRRTGRHRRKRGRFFFCLTFCTCFPFMSCPSRRTKKSLARTSCPNNSAGQGSMSLDSR
ncbi:hypothetical protein B0H65DRAFT_113354 [Neurospora tetraspora]|uniref:Uncharacterized protein n=1 Tax=Neurospora tetraspora TaxID=94610 RepID=A0AAE0MU90_9PEZI|nr:hypothetical protein B0H65DRAFT_113354 [Neurospora tetraspora]